MAAVVPAEAVLCSFTLGRALAPAPDDPEFMSDEPAALPLLPPIDPLAADDGTAAFGTARRLVSWAWAAGTIDAAPMTVPASAAITKRRFIRNSLDSAVVWLDGPAGDVDPRPAPEPRHPAQAPQDSLYLKTLLA